MSNLVPRPQSQIANQLPRGVERDIRAAQAGAAISAARVQGRAYVASVALNYVYMLSEREGQFAQLTPLVSQRYAMIVNAFTVAAALEISA